MDLVWEWHRNSPRKILPPYITLKNDENFEIHKKCISPKKVKRIPFVF
jgi:hypothetical protein